MAGIGDLLSPVPSLPPLWCVLVNPRIAVATPDVFRALAQKANPPMPEAIPAFATAQALGAWLKGQRNDLEHAAIRLQPRIAVVLNTLATLPGAMLHRMSGSGATCFALFADDAAARAAATRLSHEFPGWWVRAALLS
jgi:4-diphosphocytidyl-2-C-methyl-D-erythritol kinase